MVAKLKKVAHARAHTHTYTHTLHTHTHTHTHMHTHANIRTHTACIYNSYKLAIVLLSSSIIITFPMVATK